MKIKYSLAQLAGCLQLIFLLAIVLLSDRMLVMDLPFELNARKWHPYMYWIIVLFVFEIALSLIVIPFMKRSKKNAETGNRPKPPTWKEKIVMLVSSSCSGNGVDILFVLSFIFYMAWLPDACSDFIKDGLSPFRVLIYLMGLFVMIVFKPTIYKEPQEVNAESRTLLMTGFSDIKNKYSATIEPIIWPFADYKNIKKVVVLLTHQVRLNVGELLLEETDCLKKAYEDYKYGMIELYCKYYENEDALKIKKDLASLKNEAEKENYLKAHATITFELSMKTSKDRHLILEIEDKIRNLIKNCIKIYVEKKGFDYDLNQLEKDDAIVFTEPADYNDFDDCNEKCYDKLGSVMRHNFLDENVIVNITSGTAIVTSALTLNAIKGNRGMIYRKQNANKEDNPKMTLANPNVMMVQFNELVKEKVEHE